LRIHNIAKKPSPDVLFVALHKSINLEDVVLQFTMIAKPFSSLILIVTLAFLSCNKATPAGFWKSYQKDFLVKNISDQVPWGGHRAIYWKTGKPKLSIQTTFLPLPGKMDGLLLTVRILTKSNR